jgi:ABC-type transport system involved in multi-copper enzyme maturation permease subunit
MRPYLAVIKDSFREALASRVLWLLLVMITVVLLSIAPMGYREKRTTGLRDDEVTNWATLATRLTEIGRKDEPSPQRRIWTLLDEPLQTRLISLQEFGKESEGKKLDTKRLTATIRDAQITLADLSLSIRDLLSRKDLYDEASWKSVRLRDEAKELADAGVDKLTDEELGRLNRLLIETAFPDLVDRSPPQSLVFTFVGRDMTDAQAISKDRFNSNVQDAIAWCLKWGFGTVGIFTAILVTAPIIPQTFEPGSLHLLLSKPIWRWGLFLSKFIGGCAFILLSTAYLIAGCWLILGLRIGMWNHKMLLYIPCFLFIFTIYYAVSALAGVVWRSTVVCVVVSVLFFAICWLTGSAKVGVETFAMRPMRIKDIVPAGKNLIGVNELGMVVLWNDTERKWDLTFQTPDEVENPFRMTRPVAGPIYDAKGGQIISLQGNGFRGAEPMLSIGRGDNKWRRTPGGLAPMGTLALLPEPDGGITAVSIAGLFRLKADPAVTLKLPDTLDGDEPTIDLAELAKANPFAPAGPDGEWNLAPPWSFALNVDSGNLAVYSRGRVTVYRPNESGVYEQLASEKLDIKEDQAVAIAFGGKTLAVALEDGSIVTLDGETLKRRDEFHPEGKNQPRFIKASPGGRWFAVAFHNGKLHLLDTKDSTMTRANVSGQGDISAVTFKGPHEMLVVDSTTRVSDYRLDPTELKRRYAPQLSVMERSYYWVIVPLYTICPKPGELDKTIEYVMTGQETRATLVSTGDMSEARVPLRPWTPVWSSLAFIVVTLGVACVYMNRQEF